MYVPHNDEYSFTKNKKKKEEIQTKIGRAVGVQLKTTTVPHTPTKLYDLEVCVRGGVLCVQSYVCKQC